MKFGFFKDKRNIAAFAVSMFVNVGLLVTMQFIFIAVERGLDDLAFDALMDVPETEKQPETIKLLQEDNTASTTLNTTAGGAISTKVQAAARSRLAASQPVNVNSQMDNIVVDSPTPNINGISITSLGTDFGEDNFKGEPTAMVDGYGTALGLLTQEIQRMMRKDKLLVIWLFDKSESMKDDQREIAAKFGKVYQELNVVKAKDKIIARKIKKRRKLKKPSDRDEILLTAVYGFGNKLEKLLDPTADTTAIRTTIEEKIRIDETGEENMCAAIIGVISNHSRRAVVQKRKLVLIVVSDESGTDNKGVELALAAAKRAKAPLYFLGRESIFGYPYARHRWVDKKYGLTHWLRIDRGPETAFAECLQWDGLHARWDAFSSGFGPYEQVRLARETNGIFFVLPSEEENLAGAGANEKRQFLAHDMREYHPMWQSRSDYQTTMNLKKNKFRKTIWNVIVRLNPTKHKEGLIPKFDPNLNIREHHYPLLLAEFKQRASREVTKAFIAWRKVGQCITDLEAIEPLRAKEPSQRWRANYDLARAQCLAYRVRLFQYMLAMDEHVNSDPPRQPKKPVGDREPSNEWNVGRRRKMIVPSDEQFARIKKAFSLKKVTKDEFLSSLQQVEDRARDLYAAVEKNHTGTPWARRANYERVRGFGMFFYDRYWNPKYFRSDLKVPKF